MMGLDSLISKSQNETMRMDFQWWDTSYCESNEFDRKKRVVVCKIQNNNVFPPIEMFFPLEKFFTPFLTEYVFHRDTMWLSMSVIPRGKNQCGWTYVLNWDVVLEKFFTPLVGGKKLVVIKTDFLVIN